MNVVLACKKGRAMLRKEAGRQKFQLRGGTVSRAETGELAQKIGQPPHGRRALTHNPGYLLRSRAALAGESMKVEKDRNRAGLLQQGRAWR